VAAVKLTIAAVLAVLAEAAFVWGVELHAPWSGLVIALSAGLLIAVGFAAGPWGMVVAAAVAAASLVGPDLVDDWDLETNVSGSSSPDVCDPSCGFTPAGAFLLALPVLVGLTGLGAALRRLTRGVRRLRH
jgi:hypothetical protein